MHFSSSLGHGDGSLEATHLALYKHRRICLFANTDHCDLAYPTMRILEQDTNEVKIIKKDVGVVQGQGTHRYEGLSNIPNKALKKNRCVSGNI